MGKYKIKSELALRDICTRYKAIKLSQIESFGPVFYPIARIEADMKEKCFEDFDAVQESVLRFVALGFKDKETVAELMGLTADYVYKMFKLLLSYGHIDSSGNLTQMGRMSLEEGQKITEVDTKQVFLIDALNCNIIRVDKDLDREAIEGTGDMTNSEKHIAFIEHSSGIGKADIENTLRTSQYSTLRRIKGGMNINVTDVTDVRCLGIRYIKSYMLKLKGISPIVFVKRYDSNANGNERFFWLPLSVRDKSAADVIGDATVQFHTTDVDDMLNDAFRRMNERADSEWVNNKYAEKLSWVCENVYKLAIRPDSSPFNVGSDSFASYSTTLLYMLADFADYGLHIITDDDLAGRFMTVYPAKEDALLKECIQKYASIRQSFSREKIISSIDKSKDGQGNVIAHLNAVFERLLNSSGR